MAKGLFVSAIVVSGMSKSYGSLRAVDGLSFTVEQGEVFALLGPNGAGKTTTVEILTGHRHRNGGEVSVLGFDPATGGRAYRERIGVVLQSAGFEEEFTVRELVRLQACLYPRVHDPDEVIDLVGLADKADRPHEDPVRRAAPPPGPRARPGRRAGPAVPGRAHDGVRPFRAPSRLGPGVPAARDRHHDPAHHALHGRGAAPRRPGGRDARR